MIVLFFLLVLQNISGLKTFLLWEISNIYKSIENIVLHSPYIYYLAPDQSCFIDGLYPAPRLF